MKSSQKEGIELAKQRGAYKGRKHSLDDAKKLRILDQLRSNISKSRIAQEAGVSRETLYKFLREVESK